MNISDSVLQTREKIVFALRELYRAAGYRPWRMSKFEEYDLYANNKDFLVSDNVITFTNPSGRLMALKPDVTLSIIKNSADAPDETRRVCYDENVYRVSGDSGSFAEILQAGVECFGKVGEPEIEEVVSLAAASLRLLSPVAVLALSDLSVLADVLAPLALSAEEQARVTAAVGEKNAHEIEAICASCTDKDALTRLRGLLSVSGPVAGALSKLDVLLAGCEHWPAFRRLLEGLAASENGSMLRVDFSVVGDVNYYNGVLFKGFLPEVPTAVLSGGRYDRLMQKLRRRSGAVGFAVYTDALERIEPGQTAEPDGFVNVALPKGRLGEKIYALFAAAGYECPVLLEPNRKLIFENAEKKVRYFWVKPSDVAIYVERGAADVGVAGKDILLEYEPDVYELLDLKKGVCRMAVAAPKGWRDDADRTLRVATKFANIARQHYRSLGRDIDIIHLNGSIEIAPILGLSDVIFDIVETGATLRENNLEVVETVLPISARLIANRASYKFKSEAVDAMVARLAAVTEENQ
ncbi:MAG: ATP phosphoribosyltransferase [Clostridia bacterium]|nr:ATP phosphoribosyltransferase [Clostridia bacterium]